LKKVRKYKTKVKKIHGMKKTLLASLNRIYY
jgi:hypothetical protein